MNTRISKSIIFGVALFFVFGTTVRGQTSTTVTELDPLATVAVDLNRHVRLDAYIGREKSEEIETARDKIGMGLSFRAKPIFKRFMDSLDTDKKHALVVGAYYEYSVATEPGNRVVDQRIMLDATLRYAFKGNFLLSNRNRFELRWINNDFHFRYRNRPMLERPFKMFKRDITPYVAAEAFWDQRYNKWTIIKVSGGVVVPLNRHLSLDLLYERQHCVTCPTPNTNIFGLALNVSFLLKKKKK